MMNPLRSLPALPCLAAVATLVSFAPQAVAQDYPTKPVRLIIPYPRGGGNDTLGRIVAQRLSVALEQQVFVTTNPVQAATWAPNRGLTPNPMATPSRWDLWPTWP